MRMSLAFTVLLLATSALVVSCSFKSDGLRAGVARHANEFEHYFYYRQTVSRLQDFAAMYPSKTYLYSIGKSVEQRDLWVLAISDSNPHVHMPLRPEAKYAANIHGNGASSKEMLMNLIDLFLRNPDNDPAITTIMKTTRIHFLPSINPDGLEKSEYGNCTSTAGMDNAKGYSLNMNFPDYFQCTTDPLQPEVKSIIDWMSKNTFVVSAHIASDALAVEYPYDNGPGYPVDSVYSGTADDDIFRYMASVYASNHPYISTTSCDDRKFKDGIVNGAEWYPTSGSMQDYNYWRFGCMEITAVVSCCQFPNATTIAQMWQDNKKSLVEFAKLANTGIRGIVAFPSGDRAPYVMIRIDSREPIFSANEKAEYYRVLLPGTYNVSVWFSCDMMVYSTQVTLTKAKPLVELNITLPTDLHDIYHDVYHVQLDRYGVFCKTKQPADCPIVIEKPSSSSTISTSYLQQLALLFTSLLVLSILN